MPTLHLGSNRMGRQIREAASGLSGSGMPTSLQQALSRDDSIEYSDDSPQGNCKEKKKKILCGKS